MPLGACTFAIRIWVFFFYHIASRSTLAKLDKIQYAAVRVCLGAGRTSPTDESFTKWSSSGEEMLCQCGGVVHVLDMQHGRIKTTLGQIGDVEDEDTVTTFTLSPDNETVITSHKSGLFRLWNWRVELVSNEPRAESQEHNPSCTHFDSLMV
ncbi:unnamed protein product [Timema podura]|uniref:Uncharacterized protein n=1 Tax=Timema podura TaxID=61482 RepID=A0ABN7NWH5_TIMPD|nr:unnamed protein product [Timema podura]